MERKNVFARLFLLATLFGGVSAPVIPRRDPGPDEAGNPFEEGRTCPQSLEKGQQQHLLSSVAWDTSCVKDSSTYSSGDNHKDEGYWKGSDDNQDHFAVPPSDIYISSHPSSLTFDLAYENFDHKDSEDLIYSKWTEFDTTSSDDNQFKVNRWTSEEVETPPSIVNGSTSELDYSSIPAVVLNSDSTEEMKMVTKHQLAVFQTMLALVRAADVFDWETFESQGEISSSYNEIKLTNNGVKEINSKETYMNTAATLTDRTPVATVNIPAFDIRTTVTHAGTPAVNKENETTNSETRNGSAEEANIYDATHTNKGPDNKMSLEADGGIKAIFKESLAVFAPTSSILVTPRSSALTKLPEIQDIGIPLREVVSITKPVLETAHVISPSEVRQQNSRTSVSTSRELDHPRKVISNKEIIDVKSPLANSIQQIQPRTALNENLRSPYLLSTSSLSSQSTCSSAPNQNVHPSPLISLMKLKSQKNQAFPCPDMSQPDAPDEAVAQVSPSSAQLESVPPSQSTLADTTALRKSSTPSPRIMDLLKPKAHYRGPYEGPSTLKFRPSPIADLSRVATASAPGEKDATLPSSSIPTASLAGNTEESDPPAASEDQSPSNSFVSTDKHKDNEYNAFLESAPGDVVTAGEFTDNGLEESAEVFGVSSTGLTQDADKGASEVVNATVSTNIDADAGSIPSAEEKNKSDSEGAKDEDQTIKDGATNENEDWVQSILGWFFG